MSRRPGDTAPDLVAESTEGPDAQAKVRKGRKALQPYLRLTPQPK